MGHERRRDFLSIFMKGETTVKSFLRNICSILVILIFLSPSTALCASPAPKHTPSSTATPKKTDPLEDALEKELNNWYQAYNQEEKSERYFRLFKIAFESLSKADKAGKIGTKRYLAAIHLLLGKDKTVADYHENTENRNKLFHYFGNDDDTIGFHYFLNDCKKKGILDETASIKGNWTVEGVAKKLGVSDYTVLVMFAAMNDYVPNAYIIPIITDW